MKDIIMIKLGGSVLTDKRVPCTIDYQTVDKISCQIAEYVKERKDSIIIGNGGGSFGHFFAEKYGLNKEINNEFAYLGMCKGKNGNAFLNTKLIEYLLKYDIKACSFNTEDFFPGREIERNCEDYKRMKFFLNNNIIPVFYGDIAYYSECGCKIIPTEEILFSVYQKILGNSPEYNIRKVIFCTNTDGVEDVDGNIIPFIDKKTFHNWKIFRKIVDGYDVTGGMEEKVKMAFKFSCTVQIINGRKDNALLDALKGNNNIGTVIGEREH